MNTKSLYNNNHDNTYEKETAYQSKMERKKKKKTRKITAVGLDKFAAWFFEMFMLLLLLSLVSRARLYATP